MHRSRLLDFKQKIVIFFTLGVLNAAVRIYAAVQLKLDDHHISVMRKENQMN